MLYVYCPRNSDGARQLVQVLRNEGGAAERIKKRLPKLTSADTVVNWGAAPDQRLDAAGTVLNRNVVHNKYREFQILSGQGVNVPEFGTSPKPGWLARLRHHQGANDLLRNLSTGDYYVQYVPLVREFRVHVWDGHSIRAGMKVPRLDSPHPKFRSYDAGWKLDYGSICQDYITDSIRSQAKKAVAALGYFFGAVDTGLDATGKAWTLEVNSAPGLEGNTILAYARVLLPLCK